LLVKQRVKNRGLSLLEALILVVIVSIVAVAAGVGLQSIVRIPPAMDSILAINRQMASDMDSMKATAWASMASYSNTVTLNNKTYNRTVTVAQADADGNGVDADFRQITVAIGGQSMTTYVTQP